MSFISVVIGTIKFDRLPHSSVALLSSIICMFDCLRNIEFTNMLNDDGAGVDVGVTLEWTWQLIVGQQLSK